MKSVGLRIRVEPDLRESFVTACKADDLSAAQVLRMYMRDYVKQSALARQGDLFNDDLHPIAGIGRK